jgi:hypothetical protein
MSFPRVIAAPEYGAGTKANLSKTGAAGFASLAPAVIGRRRGARGFCSRKHVNAIEACWQCAVRKSPPGGLAIDRIAIDNG